jgi:microcin C transport system permease protein
MIFKRNRQQKSDSIMQKRWRKFKTLKRGYFSLLLIIVLYALSFCNPIFVNNKALIVKYNGKLHFPAFGKFYTTEYFGQEGFGEAQYRTLKKQFETEENNWLIMPPYPYSPIENLLDELDVQPPSAPDAKHWLGTDNRGRDVFARLLYGFNISITFALIVTFFSYIIGIFFGACLGWFGGKLDLFGVRLIEVFSGIPFLYTIMIIVSVIQPSFLLLVGLLIIMGGWMGQTFLMRGEYLREKGKDYVAAAVSMGASNRRVMFKHILPNSLTPVITFAPFAIVGYIFSLVSLDFLGFGLAPPTPSWGELMNQGVADITSWWLIAAPLGAMFITLLIINFIGEGVREAFDPKIFSRLR